MSRIKYQILLLDEGPTAHEFIRILDEHGEQALWRRLRKASKPCGETYRALHQPQIGDEVRTRGDFVLCWNRKYGYVSLSRRMVTPSATIHTNSQKRTRRSPR